MCEPNASYLAKHSELRLKNLAENYSKSTNPLNLYSMYIFKNFPDPLKLFLFLNQLQISSAEKVHLKKRGYYVLLSPLKIFATPLRALYQHFSNEGCKFRSKVAVKEYQGCASIIPLAHTFVCFLQIIYKKTLAKV